LFIPLVVVFFYLTVKTPVGNRLLPSITAQTTFIYDRTGEHLLYKLHGEENRQILAHSQIPDVMRAATIATEDASFYTHPGVDFLAVLRAFKMNFVAGETVQGGSTITQQLARSLFLSREKTLERKIMEAVYAVKLERKYTKDQILDAYLNEVPYGSNAYGIETAAETYFKKPARELTLDEAAFLAALPKAPTFYSPYGENRNLLIKRQKEILSQISALKLAAPKDISIALGTDTLKKLAPFSQPIDAPHFVFYVQSLLGKKYGENFLETGGLKIYTTLDYDKQKLAENVITDSASALKSYGAENAALAAIDPRTGQILAMVGSKNYFDPSIDGQVNVATSPRQPGSSFKPIVYAEAFEKGYQPETLILDAPTDFGPDGSGLDYIPRNYDGSFHGVLSMRQALAMSLNIPAIKTLRAVGLPDAIDMAHRLGITTLNDPHRYGLSLVIGGGEVTLLDETSAFSVFANDGKRNPIDPILEITDSQGKILYKNEAQDLPVLDPQVARKINSILSDNQARTPTFGPNSPLFLPTRTVAAKTGTTQEFRDAWTVGYTPDIAVGVWAGNNDNHPMRAGADGVFVAAPIWNRFISQALASYPDETFLAYDRSATAPPTEQESTSTGFVQKVFYYKIASGKKISETKAQKLGADKVRKEVVLVSPDGSQRINLSSQLKPAL
ncbi:MAG: transglycosylase domain-containing protein, partial [Parcubacteria group bacterium]